MFDIKSEVLLAENRIRSYIKKTPLDYSISLSQGTNINVFLKCENLQYTNAFKVRGAMNKLLSLSDVERKKGVVTASSGNHGAAVAFGLNQLGIPGKVFVPDYASSAKVENIRYYHVPVEFYGTDCMQTEIYAREYAKQCNMIYISPYNDKDVISGQGTLGLEIFHQLNNIDVVLVPIGGGGLISGIAGYLKAVSSQIKIIGCMPENSPIMAESIKQGKIVNRETLPTLSDATAGGIEPDSLTFEICQKYVDDYILVSEDEIKQAMVTLIEKQHLLGEGAAGVALASLFKKAEEFQNKNVVVIVSGGNINLTTLKQILQD